MDDDTRPAGNPLETFSPDRTHALPRRASDETLPAPAGLPGDATGTMAAPAGSAGDAELLGSAPPFVLRRRIGMGGMGEVWEAVQSKLSRPIAVKRLRSDLSEGSGTTPADVAALRLLFRQEALTAASLDHPNIVPVHDYSTDEKGFPLLAMKLVRGVTWSDEVAADFPVLPVEEFLARHLPILIGVTQAVAFAHSRGIVHRDLKPSQVMVGEFGEVVLMDWGLAVSVGDAPAPVAGADPFPAPAPDRASASNPAGTFAFMAPEQTERTCAGIGPWTDVYLLGGTLYHLLTGSYPHDAESASTAFEQARGGIVAPPAERCPGREIPDELARLAMRALAPAPADRPASAREFLAELQGFLSGAGKRRESAALVASARARLESAAGADYVPLAAGDEELSRALGLWPGNPDARPLQLRLLESYARTALLHDDLVLARLQAERLPDGPSRAELMGAVEARRAAQRRAARQRKAFLGASVVFLVLLAAGSVRYSLDQRAANRALAAERDRAQRARGDAEELIRFLLGDLREKLQPAGRLELLDEVAKRALAYFDSLPAGEADAESRARQARALMQVADVRSGRGDKTGALELLAAARALADRLVAAEPANDAYKKDVADLLARSAAAHREMGDPARSLAELREAVALLEGVVARNPSQAGWAGDLVETRRFLALALRSSGDLDGALALAGANGEVLERLAAADPKEPAWKVSQASNLSFTAWILRAKGRLDEAAAGYRAADDLLGALLASDPGHAVWKAEKARTSSHLAVVHQARGDYAAALAAAREDLRLAVELAATDPENADWQAELGIAHGLVGGALRAAGDAPAALREFLAYEETIARLAAREPGNLSVARELAIASIAVAGARLDLREFPAALRSAGKALDLLAPVTAKQPNDQQARRRTGQAQLAAGHALAGLGRGKEADARWRDAVATLEPIAATSDDTMFLSPWAEALAMAGDPRAKEAVERLLAKGWKDPRQRELFRKKGLGGG